MFVFFVLVIGALVAPSLQNWGGTPIRNMTIIHSWKNLEYGFDSRADYEYSIANGTCLEPCFKRPYDADIGVNRKRNKEKGDITVFISTPRVVPWIPYTLARVSKQMGRYGPILKPYPNYKAHSPKDSPGCNRIISVFRIFVDPCNRLWAIDTGRNFQATPTQVCPPKILVYDLNTDRLVLNYTIPEDQYIPDRSVHNGIIVDIYDPPPKGKCRKGKAYLTDARGYSFLVFDLEQRVSWVIFNELFKPDPNYTTSTIAGESFTFPDGLYTSTPYRKKDILRLHSYASLSEIGARLSLINNQSLWMTNSSGHQEVFQVVGTRPTQSPTQAIDSNGIIYSSLLNPLSIFSWSPEKPYNLSNFKTVVENEETLQFVAGVKVRYNSDGKEILVALSNRLQKLNTGTISLAEENYRFMVCKTSTLQAGKGKCGGL